jgi:hypothetical protein
MPIYLCRWPDGDVSLIDGEDEPDILLALDEIGDPSDVTITELEVPLSITLRLNDSGELVLAPVQGHFMFQVKEDAYPALTAVEDAIIEERGSQDWTPEDLEKVRQAVILERGGTDVQQ